MQMQVAGVKSLLRFENHEELDGFLSDTGILVGGFSTGSDFMGAGTLFVGVLTDPAFLRSASSYRPEPAPFDSLPDRTQRRTHGLWVPEPVPCVLSAHGTFFARFFLIYFLF